MNFLDSGLEIAGMTGGFRPGDGRSDGEARAITSETQSNLMEDFKIIVFLCNWGPHAAYNSLQDDGYRIPATEVRMVRIPCTGRISKALLFKAFELGADGVALVGCAPGTCRYGSGTRSAVNHANDTGNILELLGLGKDRLRLATFLPDDTEGLRTFLEDFTEAVRRLGKTPVAPDKIGEGLREREEIASIVARYDAFGCQDCGKCTSSCPLALSGKEYSPRSIVNAIVRGETASERVAKDVNACLTCGVCYERCPSDVNFPEFVRDVRCNWPGDSARGGEGKHLAHGGFFQSLMRSMTSEKVAPERWRDLPEEIETDPRSDVLFFGGCAPYFDTFFRSHLNVDTSRILEDALRLLNFFDVRPRLMEAERCCGHDLLWSGDRENFLRLAKLNVEAMGDAGVKTVITSCPECYRTLKFDYKACGIEPPFEVKHLYELLEDEIDKGAVAFKSLGKRITYQDSCRLNRLEETRDLPRKLMGRLSSEGFSEMKDSGPGALCCGNCAWIGCDAYSKALQVKRLRQARDTGSDLMVTSCPKCQIHLRCAMEDPFRGEELRMDMADLASVVAQTIRWE